jgi:hypothetical protein
MLVEHLRDEFPRLNKETAKDVDLRIAPRCQGTFADDDFASVRGRCGQIARESRGAGGLGITQSRQSSRVPKDLRGSTWTGWSNVANPLQSAVFGVIQDLEKQSLARGAKVPKSSFSTDTPTETEVECP